ncbi:hypothetical protein [Paenibacillus chibensis]|uniref:hypothetical protein n=1 Tax=Paenibacillus chibensis TaxID=59846 RepID=UPI000FD95718|nr:hypothetical protein [Paenibacillus chibensis]MEC0369196.1 hypothetical protein [Paenibacillus chibensis]
MSMTKEIAKRILSYAPYRFVNVGREFSQWLAKFENTREMSKKELQDLQWKSLTSMVREAYDQTHFYRDLYREHGFHPDDLKDWSDVNRIPIINKEMIRAAGKDVVSRKYSLNRLKPGTTSGTTGSSLTFYSNRMLEQREWAATCFLWGDVGYRPGDGRVELRGLITDERVCIPDPYHRIIRINVARMNKDNVGWIMEQILQSGYEFIHAYPSSLSLLSKLLLETGLIGYYEPKALLIVSEMLHTFQELQIRKAFPGAPIHVHYGQSEKVVMAGRVEHSPYHFLPLYGFVEQHPVTGGVIGTSLINDVMPIIRYELADAVPGLVDSEEGPHYMFPSVSSIDGRISEIMYKPNGDMVSSALLAIMVRGLSTITACKFIQRKYDEIDIIVESAEPGHMVMDEMEKCISKLYAIFTNAMKFKVEIMERIPKTAAGKLKFVEVLMDQEEVK